METVWKLFMALDRFRIRLGEWLSAGKIEVKL